MTTYKPYGMTELQSLLQQAAEQKLPVLTRHQHSAGLGIDFQNWNKIREIDTVNLTVTAERAVTFGELEEAVNEKGLHVAMMTEDLRAVNLGDFFAEQMYCLTSLHYNQPRLQILGLEVLLADGTVLQVAGKTVKNVTGYDMCRFYISNREQLAIPLAFTIKLVSLEAVQTMLEAHIADEAVLVKLAARLRQQNITPQVCLYWNKAAAELLQQAEPAGRLIMVCNGSKQRLEKDLQAISAIADELQIGLQLCEQPEQVWYEIKMLRTHTVWGDGVKVPSLRCDGMLRLLAKQQIACWYNPLQGSLQLIPAQADGVLYRQLCSEAEALGGAGNWYYMYQYGFAAAGETKIWQRLKQKFDAGQRLNPLTEGGVEHGAE